MIQDAFDMTYSFVMRDGYGVAWRIDEPEFPSHCEMAHRFGLTTYAKGCIGFNSRMVLVVLRTPDMLNEDEIAWFKAIAGDRCLSIQIAGSPVQVRC